MSDSLDAQLVQLALYMREARDAALVNDQPRYLAAMLRASATLADALFTFETGAMQRCILLHTAAAISENVMYCTIDVSDAADHAYEAALFNLEAAGALMLEEAKA